MKVIVRSKTGVATTGRAILSPGGHKTTVRVVFDIPIEISYSYGTSYKSSGEEFRLSNGFRNIWGQGMDYDLDDLILDKEDCEKIISEGGG